MDHDPNRQTWDCQRCGNPWPCVPAQRYMLTTMSPTELRIRQWMVLEEAALTLVQDGKPDFRALWARFFDWASPTSLA